MTQGKLTEDQKVYQYLKGEIVTGKRNPGERIVVAQISDLLGVSSMPVRAALKLLQQDGLVEIIPYAGATVKKVDETEYEEISAIRQLLEPYAAQLATICMTEKEIEELQEIVDEMEVCVENTDSIGYSSCNTRFHIFINNHCGNRMLSNLLLQLMDLSKITRQFYILRNDRIPVSLQEHKKILQLIKERKAEEVAELIKMNKQGGSDAILRDIRGI